MTVAQLTQESKARDPTLVGLSKKNKEVRKEEKGTTRMMPSMATLAYY